MSINGAFTSSKSTRRYHGLIKHCVCCKEHMLCTLALFCISIFIPNTWTQIIYQTVGFLVTTWDVYNKFVNITNFLFAFICLFLNEIGFLVRCSFPVYSIITNTLNQLHFLCSLLNRLNGGSATLELSLPIHTIYI